MEKRIRFNDVAAGIREQREDIQRAIEQVIERGDFINGRSVTSFEAAFSQFCGTEHCVGAANGTSALHMALFAAGVQPGDEVITAAMTFIASSEAITHCGAKVVFADIDPNTLNLDARDAASRITSRTRAILFVHLHGNPTGVREARQLADKHHLVLVEDCAQAHGAGLPEADGSVKHVGNFGVAGTFSFFPAKNLGAFGDAGAVVTNDADLAHRARQMANHGREEKYQHQFEGYNYRLDTLQAAILEVRLASLRAQVTRRNKLAERYISKLRPCGFSFQELEPGAVHARHLFVIETDRREKMQKYLKERGIETGIHYPIALHRQPAYRYLGMNEGSLPVAERIAKTTLSLPFYPQMQDADVDYVCDAVGQL